MQYGKVEICGINTSELKVLGEKEKMDLLRKAQAGDKQARDALICGNLRLVLSVIQRFSGRGESMDLRRAHVRRGGAPLFARR